MLIFDQPRPPYVVECRIGQWCDPATRGELANDLGDGIAALWPSSLSSGPVTVAPGLGELTYTGFAPTAEIGAKPGI